jgi:hypothetical protein
MKKLLIVVAAVLSLAVSAGPAWAECCKHGDQCPISQGKDRGESRGKDSKHSQCPITDKTIEKAKFFLKNAAELGLSEEQTQAIKTIKVEAKKAAIRQEAEMEMFMMDVESKLADPVVDVEGLGAMFDTASAGMSTEAKGMIAQYAKLKGILSKEQMAKAKEIWTKRD